MSKFTEMWDKVLKEKLVAKTKVGNTDFSLNDKGRVSAKGKIGNQDISANSDGHVQATGPVAGGTMSTAVNKDGDGGSAFTDKKGRTVSHTAGARDAWVSKGPNQPSQRVPLNNTEDDDQAMSKDEYWKMRKQNATSSSLGTNKTWDAKTQEKFNNYEKANKQGKYSGSKVRQSVDFDDDLDEGKIMEDEAVQYDAHGFGTVHNNGKFYLIFNDEVVGEYDTIEELKAAHEHVINKIKLPEDEQMNEESDKEWEIVINGNVYDVAYGDNEDEAINSFWKNVVEKEGIERFLGDMIYATSTSMSEDLDSLKKNAGL